MEVPSGSERLSWVSPRRYDVEAVGSDKVGQGRPIYVEEGGLRDEP